MLVPGIARARPRLGGALQTVFGMLVASIARAWPRLGAPYKPYACLYKPSYKLSYKPWDCSYKPYKLY